MTDGSSQGLFVIVAVVIFGIFVAISYVLFQDQMKTGLSSIFSESIEQANKNLLGEKVEDKEKPIKKDYGYSTDKHNDNLVIKSKLNREKDLIYEKDGLVYAETNTLMNELKELHKTVKYPKGTFKDLPETEADGSKIIKIEILGIDVQPDFNMKTINGKEYFVFKKGTKVMFSLYTEHESFNLNLYTELAI